MFSYGTYGTVAKIGTWKLMVFICKHDDQTTSYLSSTEPNWSSVDVDAPYTWCWECKGVCTCNMENDEGSTNCAGNRDCEINEYQSCTGNENLSNECN